MNMSAVEGYQKNITVLSNFYEHTLDAVVPIPRSKDRQLGRIDFAVCLVDKGEIDTGIEAHFRGNVWV